MRLLELCNSFSARELKQIDQIDEYNCTYPDDLKLLYDLSNYLFSSYLERSHKDKEFTGISVKSELKRSMSDESVHSAQDIPEWY